uniref:Alpha-macroglobulin receptor-binding domain-containing protein n=1 Tax=Accipiter nisus TaxID=211598 RepID=A0A8B9MIZ0_9AVES
MVIVDVKMLSGFIPVKSSVRKVGYCLSNKQHLSSRHLPNVCSKLEGFTVCISLLFQKECILLEWFHHCAGTSAQSLLEPGRTSSARL